MTWVRLLNRESSATLRASENLLSGDQEELNDDYILLLLLLLSFNLI